MYTFVVNSTFYKHTIKLFRAIDLESKFFLEE